MPEPGDPADLAYLRAEEILDDHEGIAARRARLLNAMTESSTHSDLSPVRHTGGRRDRWLAAASIAGLGVFLATRVYQLPPQPSRTIPTSPATYASRSEQTDEGIAERATIGKSEPLEQAPAVKPSLVPVPAPAKAPAPLMATPPLPDVKPMAAAPLTMAKPRTSPAEPGSSAVQEEIVTAGRSPPQASSNQAVARDENLTTLRLPRLSEKSVPPPPPPPPAPLVAGSESMFGASSTRAEMLRSASANGRLSDIEKLLEQGVPVDAADAEGETPLMKSIQADRPEAAALLLRHGARLDQLNNAGVSARRMATAVGDPALERALRLTP